MGNRLSGHLSQHPLPAAGQAAGLTKNVNKAAGNISYANGWTYGSNLASIDFEDFSARGDPANSVTGHADSNSAEVYAVFRSVLSGNKVTGSMFSFGPIRDVGLLIDFDFDTQNDQFASYKKLVTFGLQFSFNLPRGFLNVTLPLRNPRRGPTVPRRTGQGACGGHCEGRQAAAGHGERQPAGPRCGRRRGAMTRLRPVASGTERL